MGFKALISDSIRRILELISNAEGHQKDKSVCIVYFVMRPKVNEKINEKISVISRYDKLTGIAMPVRIRWQNKVRTITKVGFHHTKRDGRKLIHIFTVTDGNLAYYLSFDTETLHWTLLEVSDGIAG